MHAPLDYEAVGLKCGLEVHQQLLTDRKLFCRCPAGLYREEHDGQVLRHMRPTLSELGVYDGTALMEFKTKKNIVYLLHRDNVCTYEMDDTPPFLVNQQAVDVAIEQCLMLGCDIVDEVHIARKQYLDGSIPTGFQRTAIVGVNGKLPFRGREITVVQVSVEEDSCREVSDTGHLITWRTDRLGMPLIETVTAPDLKTPDEVEEAILLVGRVCRSTGHVRTGLGASRQDVNVSVRGGRRVEIKGVPKASWAPRLVHGEAWRQVNLLRLRDELARRGVATREDVRHRAADVTDVFEGGMHPRLRRSAFEAWAKEQGRRPGYELGRGDFQVRAVALEGLAGILSWPTQPGRTFADELKGRVRVIACLDQLPILLHSEDWPGHPGAEAELHAVYDRLEASAEDAVVVVWGPADDVDTAVREIVIRTQDAVDGVPEETRQPFPDGSTDFERILPGPDRMYPDTDSPPTRVTRDRVEGLERTLPENPWTREARWTAAGVPRPVTWYLIRRGGAFLVDRLVEAGAEVGRAARFVGEDLKGLRRGGVRVDAVPTERWVEWARLTREAPVAWEAWEAVACALARRPERPLAEVRDALSLGRPPEGWEAEAGRAAREAAPDHPDGSVEQRIRMAMAEAMPPLRGRVPGRRVREVIEAELKAGAGREAV